MTLAGPATVEELAVDLHDAIGCGLDVAEEQVGAALVALETLGLVNRSDHSNPPTTRSGRSAIVHSGHAGVPHDLFGRTLRFRSSDRELLGLVDSHVAAGLLASSSRGDSIAPRGDGRVSESGVTVDLEMGPDGRIAVAGKNEWVFPGIEPLLRQLDTIVEEIAARTDDQVVLRVSSVVLPDGSVALIAGSPATPVPTLLADLIRAGADLIGSRLTCMTARTSVISGLHRHLLLTDVDRTTPGTSTETTHRVPPADLRRGAAGCDGYIDRVAAVYCPQPALHALDATSERLDSIGALQKLMELTANSDRFGQKEFEALCHLAERTPVLTVTYDDLGALCDQIVDGSLLRSPTGISIRKYEPPAELRPRLRPDVALGVTELEDRLIGFASTSERSLLILDPLTAAICKLSDGTRTVDDILTAIEQSPGGCSFGWRSVVGAMYELVVQGLLDPVPSVWLPIDAHNAVEWPEGPWRGSGFWIAENPPAEKEVNVSVEGWAVQFRGLTVATRDREVQRLLQPSLLHGSAREIAPGTQVAAISLLRIEQLVGNSNAGYLFHLDRARTYPVDRVELGSVLGALLAAVAVSEESDLVPIAPVWSSAGPGGLEIVVGPPPGAPDEPNLAQGDDKWRLAFGVVVSESGSLLVPSEYETAGWLALGARLDDAGELFRTESLACVVAPPVVRQRTSSAALADWIELIKLLRFGPDHRRRYVSRLVCTCDNKVRSSRARPEPTLRPSGSRQAIELLDWAESLGPVAVWDQSVKVSIDSISPPRPLYRVDIGGRLEDGAVGRSHGVVRMQEEFQRLGLEANSANQAARIACSVGEFHIGEERSEGGHWRRKLYVWTISDDVWAQLASDWPESLSPRSHPSPSWVAWKFSSRHLGQVERSIDLPYLGGAGTYGEAVRPMLSRLPREWVDSISRFVDQAAIDMGSRPSRDDAVTVDEGGRQTVDLAFRHSKGSLDGLHLEGAIRWLVAVSGHTRKDADDLVRWAADRRLANLIFGVDRDGSPFTNLYMSSALDHSGLGRMVPVSRSRIDGSR